MCGITGLVSFAGHRREQAEPQIERMTRVIAHRGPDGQGTYVDDYAALGHRRLAIIDLDTGDQPMVTPSGGPVLVFNGEVYNFLDLRRDLEAHGHVFRTHSDTEVVLRAYLEWGEHCAERLFGMFAFAIWDPRDRSIFLARDRVGKKPLYYSRRGDTFVFASELKSLRRATGFTDQRIDRQMLDCYLTLGYIPTPGTIYEGVHKLRPGHTLTVATDTSTERRYWQLDYNKKRSIGLGEALEEFDSLLDKVVDCRLMSEVPLGAFLSGGVDSSLVVSSMAKLTDDPVATHTIGFGDKAFDETETARRTAQYLGAQHQEFRVEPNAAQVLEDIAWHFDEPMADSSALPTWYVCELTRQSVTVALSGDGGDEGFGGYTFRYTPHVFESRIRSALPDALRSLVFGPLSALWPRSAKLPKFLRLGTIWENLAVSDAEAYYMDLVWLNKRLRSRVYNQDFMASLRGYSPLEHVHGFYCSSHASDPLSRSQYADVNVYMTDDVLVKVDRMSMAHALEVRAPLLDHRVLEFGAQIPNDLKLSGNTGKLLLRSLAQRRLPPEITSLPKMGFSIPLASWLRQELRESVEERLRRSTGVVDEALDSTHLMGIWREHQRGHYDHSVFLWAVLMLGMWDDIHNTAEGH